MSSFKQPSSAPVSQNSFGAFQPNRQLPKTDKDKLFSKQRIQNDESFMSSSEGAPSSSSFNDPKRSYLAHAITKQLGEDMSMGANDLERSIRRVEQESKRSKQKKKEFDEDDEDDDLHKTKSLGSQKHLSVAQYDINVDLRENEKPSLILYKYRWVVLAAFFMTSAATGAVQGSLSTNRAIIDKIEDKMDKEQLDWAKYSDLVLYFPMNFASIWLIENHGLKKCISLGSIIMIVGSVLRLMSTFGSIWFWFVGHIVCMSAQAYLKNPVTKLASNWFGDKERGMATAIGIVSGPLGIFISKVLIMSCFENADKIDQGDGGTPLDVTIDRFHTFMLIHGLITIAMVLPALFLIREKPPSPPSMVATKPRPVQTFREAFNGLRSNYNYILVFMYFNCVNTVAIYNGEIEPFTNQYIFTLGEQTWASMLNCVAGITGSILIGKYLDRSKKFKMLQIVLAVAVSVSIMITFMLLHYDAPNIAVVGVAILAGAPISSISVISYQFAAEVIYPISEVQGVSLMNVFNKLATLGVVKFTSAIVDDTPEHINYMYGFILWITLPLIGLIPAFLVEEDLRRLNMKDVMKSLYVEETTLLKQTEQERKDYYKNHHIIANQEVLEHFFVIDAHRSARETYRSERLTTDDADRSIRRRHRSGEARTSGTHQTLLRKQTIGGISVVSRNLDEPEGFK